ncbi:hypothetical protein [uncultured Stenotrophomonas sp.]|uniref:hypothetical protein n=1 Tax=uncultured Stenotrophomonas sp. TaxID=165438 RepID=UPI0025EFBB25|nr:hypothetical protein [uncultured Stenotrophomonas sp.]
MKIVAVLFMLLAAAPLVLHHIARYEARCSLNRLSRQPPIRELSEEENAALEPFRAILGLGTGTRVHLLEGPCVEHRIWMRGVSSGWHSIGSVRILLPFNALEHVGPANRAQVVLGRGFAVVVRMGAFEIATAGTRTLRTAARQISERFETEEEGAQRRRPKAPWAATTLALAAGACGVLPQMDGGRWTGYALAVGLALATAAFFFYRRRQVGPRAPQRIVRVRGRLSALDIVDPCEATYTHGVMLLGSNQQLVIDPVWRLSGAIKPGRWVEAEVCALDRRLLSLGPGWCLQDDLRRFPPVPVARHLLMFITALASLMLLLWSGDPPQVQAQRAAELAGPGVLRGDALPATLLDTPPAVGDGMRVTATTTCELVPRMHDGYMLAVPDCTRLRWAGTPVHVPPLAVPASILRLGSDSALSVHRRRDDGPFPAYQAVSGLVALRQELDAACEDGLTACASLRARLATLPQDDTAVLPWPSVSGIQHTFREAANAHVLVAWAAATPGLLAAQRGGVVLVDAGAKPSHVGALASGVAGRDWERMREAVTTARQTTWSGVLQSRSSDGHTLWLEVDRERPANGAFAGLVYWVWLVGAAVLVWVQGYFLVRAVPRALSRSAAFAEELKQRPAPHASWPT